MSDFVSPWSRELLGEAQSQALAVSAIPADVRFYPFGTAGGDVYDAFWTRDELRSRNERSLRMLPTTIEDDLAQKRAPIGPVGSVEPKCPELDL